MSFKDQYSFELSYNPYNFYYSTNREDLPNEETCKNLEEQKDTLGCDSIENSRKCYEYELCHNKELAGELYERRLNHITSNAAYDNLHLKYQYALLKTVNLSAGIIASLVFIYYYNK